MNFKVDEYWTNKENGRVTSFSTYEVKTLSQALRQVAAAAAHNVRGKYNDGSRKIRFLITNKTGRIIATIHQS